MAVFGLDLFADGFVLLSCLGVAVCVSFVYGYNSICSFILCIVVPIIKLWGGLG